MITLDLSKAKLNEDLGSYKDKVAEIHDMIHNKTGAGNDFLGWVELPENFDKEEGDIDGPFGVGVSAVRKLDDETSATLIVYGCDQLFTDEANSMVSGANQVLFTNTVSSFVDHEVSVSIPAKSYEISYLTVPQSKAMLVGLMTVIVVPVGCLAAGFVIWFRRRKR